MGESSFFDKSPLSLDGVGSKRTHPCSGKNTSTQEWALLSRTKKNLPYSFHSPPRNPFTILAGIPISLRSTTIEVAKYSQCPALFLKRKSSIGNPAVPFSRVKV